MIIGILTAVTQACKCLTSCVKEFEKKTDVRLQRT